MFNDLLFNYMIILCFDTIRGAVISYKVSRRGLRFFHCATNQNGSVISSSHWHTEFCINEFTSLIGFEQLQAQQPKCQVDICGI